MEHVKYVGNYQMNSFITKMKNSFTLQVGLSALAPEQMWLSSKSPL